MKLDDSDLFFIVKCFYSCFYAFQLSSAGRLGAARDARALTYLIKDLEAKLGPLEISSKTNAGEAGGESNVTKEEKTDSSPEKTKDNEAGGESNGTKQEINDSSPEKTKDGEAVGESNGTKEETTDASPEKMKDGEAGEELNDSKEGKTDSSPKTTNDGEEGGELSDKKEGKTDLSSKKEESLKPFSGKEDRPESSIEHIQRGDSSPGKCSTSSYEHEENGNLQDEKEELTESAHREEKSPDSPLERKILMEPPAAEGAEESTLEKEVHAESPTMGDEGI